jgi:F0F1-type ATP synthase assembly protein I
MNGWTVALRVAGLGWFVAVSVVAGILGGYFLDKAAGTTPLFTLIGTVLGSVVAFYGVYKMIVPVLYGSKGQGDNARGRRRQ